MPSRKAGEKKTGARGSTPDAEKGRAYRRDAIDANTFPSAAEGPKDSYVPNKLLARCLTPSVKSPSGAEINPKTVVEKPVASYVLHLDSCPRSKSARNARAC